MGKRAAPIKKIKKRKKDSDNGCSHIHTQHTDEDLTDTGEASYTFTSLIYYDKAQCTVCQKLCKWYIVEFTMEVPVVTSWGQNRFLVDEGCLDNSGFALGILWEKITELATRGLDVNMLTRRICARMDGPEEEKFSIVGWDPIRKTEMDLETSINAQLADHQEDQITFEPLTEDEEADLTTPEDFGHEIVIGGAPVGQPLSCLTADCTNDDDIENRAPLIPLNARAKTPQPMSTFLSPLSILQQLTTNSENALSAFRPFTQLSVVAPSLQSSQPSPASGHLIIDEGTTSSSPILLPKLHCDTKHVRQIYTMLNAHLTKTGATDKEKERCASRASSSASSCSSTTTNRRKRPSTNYTDFKKIAKIQRHNFYCDVQDCNECARIRAQKLPPSL